MLHQNAHEIVMEYATHNASKFTQFKKKIHLYDDTFVYTRASLILHSNVTFNSVLALSGFFQLVDWLLHPLQDP